MTDAVTRTERGRYLAGHKSKGGRPRGPSPAEQVRQLLKPHQAALVARAVELALAGDPAALKLCLERLAPAPKPEAEKIVIPGLAGAGSIQGKCDAILAAVADGHISTEAGERALRMLSTYLNAVVADNHEQRLLQLEEGKVLLAALATEKKKDPPEDLEVADIDYGDTPNG